MQRKLRRRWQRLAKAVLPPIIAADILILNYLSLVCANPIGGSVANGAVSITTNGSVMTIKQTTNKAIINWQHFNIAKGETLHFIQPTASAIALNRVIGNDASSIYGTLTANGKVFLINPNGILFAPGAQVNVGGLTASTLSIKDRDFLAGKDIFAQTDQAGAVINKGNITALDHAVLIGPHVKNEGVMSAKVTALAAGNRVRLDFNGDKLLNVAVDLGAAGASAVNTGRLVSDGGLVVMSAGTKDLLLDTIVNNSGLIRAQNVYNTGGVIRLEGNTVKAAGTLDASAPSGGNGGLIETSGAKINIDPHLVLTASAAHGASGHWLIDPTDFTIGAEASGTNYLNNEALSNSLQTTNVTVQTDNSTKANGGDLSINAPIHWSANTILTLSAAKNININANVNIGGDTAGLVITPNNAANGAGGYRLGAGASITLTGANPSVNIAGHSYNVIHTVSDLQNIRSNAYYALGDNIDASATARYGFAPIQSFLGIFDGFGHTIHSLAIHCTDNDGVGLFKENSGTIKNLSLANAVVSGVTFVGAFAGHNFGVIDACNTINGAVDGVANVGGLAGHNAGSITKSYNTSQITAVQYGAGGLAGFNSGAIDSSYNGGKVSGYTQIGGLAGSSSGYFIENAYNSGSVIGNNQVGGLVGANVNGSKLMYCYNTGLVASSDPKVINSNIGGLVGYNYSPSSIQSCYWNSGKSAPTVPSIGVAFGFISHVSSLSEAAMMKTSSFADWDIAATGGSQSVWRIYEGFSAPLLKVFLTPLTVSAGNASKTYDANPYTDALLNTRYIAPNAGYANCPGTIKGLLTYGDYKNAGVYHTLSGLYSNDQQGFDISYATSSALTINKRALTVTADSAAKYFGQPNPPLTYTINGLARNDAKNLVVDDITASTSATRTSPVGRYDITVTGKLLSSNYTVNYANGILIVKSLTSPAYDSAVTAANQAFSLDGYWRLSKDYLNEKKARNQPLFAILPPGINMTGYRPLSASKQWYK